LNRIPFEILIDDKGDFLLDTYAISYNHSASLFTNKKTNSQNSTILVFAPYANGAFQKTTFRDRNLGSLPFSTKEVENIKGITYKNQSATKNRFLQDYQKHGVIHFATHAQMDDTDPSKSFIAFYPDSSDYKLYTEELYNLSLKNTQLVVLSACEAGGGKLQKGEGLMSLARGFAYAGCPAVITTLWKANDESTAWLSERLHHYLNKGWNKSEALRQAKIDFRASDIGQEYDHPYFWANFILIGDDAPLQRTFWDEYKWWLIATFIVAIILILYLNLSKSSGQN
jgi:CHAT domain-containing protein